MSSKSGERPLVRTVTARLTLWYCAVFAVPVLAVFTLVYSILARDLNQRVNQDLADDLAEFAELYRTQGLTALQAEFDREAASDGVEVISLVLFGPDLEVRAASDLSSWQGPDTLRPDAVRVPRNSPLIRTIRIPGKTAPARVAVLRLEDGTFLLAAKALDSDRELLASYRRVCAIGLVVMLVSGGLTGWFLAKRAMAGVARVTRTAWQIGASDLGRRVPVGNEGEEIRELAEAFNQMLERIRSLVAELREVSNNIAHDLRSPLTRIRGLAEAALTHSESLDEYRRMAGAVVEECDHLVNLINTMLEIAETDAGATRLARTPVDIRALIEDAHDLFLASAEEAGVQFTCSVPEDASPAVTGDRGRLERALANLIDNAIKYTPRGGTVEVRAERSGEWIHVSVADTGAGIPPDELPRVFDRFHRGDRSRTTAGNGLGLSLARAVVRAHGGEITVVSRVNQGSTFTLRLPALCSPSE
ncbi:MAG: HAMP domain-containing protein [Kiritimatiellaeota bacterium]|nr:HAMP domain-containing protein [Kiritimatiellota bacterium]